MTDSTGSNISKSKPNVPTEFVTYGTNKQGLQLPSVGDPNVTREKVDAAGKTLFSRAGHYDPNTGNITLPEIPELPSVTVGGQGTNNLLPNIRDDAGRGNPKTPTIGKELFPTSIYDIQNPWVNPAPDPYDGYARTITTRAEGGVNTNFKLDEFGNVIRKVGDPNGGPFSEKLFDGNIYGSATTAYQSKQTKNGNFEFRITGMAAVASKGDGVTPGVDLLRQYNSLAPKVNDLAGRFQNLQVNVNTQIRPQVESLRVNINNLKSIVGDQTEEGKKKAGALLAQINEQVRGLQADGGKINEVVKEAGSLLGSGESAVNSVSDGIFNSSFEVGAGAYAEADAIWRMPIGKKDARGRSDTNLAVRGKLYYIPENPGYDDKKTDQPQPKYLMALMRTDATAIVKGTEPLKQGISELHSIYGQLGDLAGSAIKDLDDISKKIGNIQSVEDIERAKKVLGEININATNLGQSGAQIDRIRDSANSVVKNIDTFSKNLDLALDVRTTMVTPTSNFGAGADVGLSHNIHIKNKDKKDVALMNMYVTAENIVGVLPGKEEVWKLDNQQFLTNGKVSFNKLEDTNRNVYHDFFPRKYAVGANVITKGGTGLMGRVEKVDGISGLNTYIGASQRMGEFTINAGRLHDATTNTDWTTAGVQMPMEINLSVFGKMPGQLFINYAKGDNPMGGTQQSINAGIRAFF